MTSKRYFQPVAVHRKESERLLLNDDLAKWYLWMGDQSDEPVPIPDRLAWYLTGRPEMQRLESPRMWFALDDLPRRETAISEPEADPGEFGMSM